MEQLVLHKKENSELQGMTEFYKQNYDQLVEMDQNRYSQKDTY